MPDKAEISAEDLEKYAAECDGEVFEALERASENIKEFHKRQLQQSWLTTKENGVIHQCL